ncbi:MAG: ABC transporter permease subunit [Verrucomicrobiota bacterium]
MNFFNPIGKLSRAAALVDVAVLGGIGALIYLLIQGGEQWTAEYRQAVEINLSPWALPRYTMFSVFRNFVAYGLSLAFTLVFGRLAAVNRRTESVLVPVLDILQSVPVLGFLPGLVLGLVAIFPKSNLGLELACIVMMFTSQAWNMTFSFYQSVKSIPAEMNDAAKAARLTWWQRYLQLELPAGAGGLVWNSMMSMAGGWFFLMVCEAFTLGSNDFRLPGIGSYMSVAIEKNNVPAMCYGILAMSTVIVVLDQLVWRPLVVWSAKFRFDEESGEQPTSRVLEWYQSSRVLAWVNSKVWRRLIQRVQPKVAVAGPSSAAGAGWVGRVAGWIAVVGGAVGLVWGATSLWGLLAQLQWADWQHVAWITLMSFLRVMAAVAVGAAWAIPFGVLIGTSPRLAKVLQPVIQVVASFPAPMVFPLLLLLFTACGIPMTISAALLMLAGTQWYILFNVISGAMVIPQDLKEAGTMFRLRGRERWRLLIVPGIFSQLVVGLATAAGGAWNASICTEYVRVKGTVMSADGLGSAISICTDQGNFPLLAATVTAMVVVVVGMNRLVWLPLYRLSERKYSLG